MKKYTTHIIIALALIGTVGLIWSARQDASTNKEVSSASSASLVAETDQFDFGTIDIFDGKVETTYTLKNEGTEDVMVTAAETSCMCTEGEIAGFKFGMHGSDVRNVVIPAGEEEVVTAVYDPLAHGPNGTGKITRVLTLETNSVVTPEISLNFKANVVKK